MKPITTIEELKTFQAIKDTKHFIEESNDVTVYKKPIFSKHEEMYREVYQEDFDKYFFVPEDVFEEQEKDEEFREQGRKFKEALEGV